MVVNGTMKQELTKKQLKRVIQGECWKCENELEESTDKRYFYCKSCSLFIYLGEDKKEK